MQFSFIFRASFAVVVAFTSVCVNAQKALPPAARTTSGEVTDPKLIGLLKKLDSSIQNLSATMQVAKSTKLAVLEQEKSAKGTAWISKGRLRMELDGSEKSLLVVNKKDLWAVTFPDPDFKDAPISVIRGNLGSKKGRSQNALSLLVHGGFLKFFTVTFAKTDATGVTFELTPKKDQSDFTRAVVKVSGDGASLLELKYWDQLQNETSLTFSQIKSEKNIDEKLFTYSPPAGASVMNLQ